MAASARQEERDTQQSEGEVNPPSDQEVSAKEAEADGALRDKQKSVRRECFAWADPDSVVIFSVTHRIKEYFDIDLKPNDLSNPVKVLGADKSVGAEATQSNAKRSKIDGASKAENMGVGKRIMKAIKVPTGGEYQGREATSGGQDGKFNHVTIRVPSRMNVNAICLWINTQFKNATKRPDYFITQGGMKYYIDSSYTDKTKLRQLSNTQDNPKA